eukprot:TRINITY_DN74772_c0_g1_i1.p1 TRINITY_DN74772_c0_g1~~TRINITY_DN74772_c0_g1_i1.p1  ORF type:complete len:340 (-),score=10.24 TRINITY_DN74772_c0_g1_i1:188-1207(-)
MENAGLPRRHTDPTPRRVNDPYTFAAKLARERGNACQLSASMNVGCPSSMGFAGDQDVDSAQTIEREGHVSRQQRQSVSFHSPGWSTGPQLVSFEPQQQALPTLSSAEETQRYKSFPSLSESEGPGYGASGVPDEWRGKTSVLVRNLSYMCTRKIFEEMLKEGFDGLYDYLYVPMDVARSTSKGYAFVNFVDPPTAYRFHQVFHRSMPSIPGTLKLLDVIPSHLQGRAANVSHAKLTHQPAADALDLREIRATHPSTRRVPVNEQPEVPSSFARHGLQEGSGGRCTSHITPGLADSQERDSTARTQATPANVTPPFCYMCGKARGPLFNFCEFCGVRFH